MEKKRLTKTMWYGSDVDHAGNAILPEAAASDNHLSGLNEGEIYIHNHPSNPSIWTRTTDGKIVSISGVDISVLEKLFLSKTKDDRTSGSLGVGGSLDVGSSLHVGGNLDVNGKAIAKKGVQFGESFVPGILTGLGGNIDERGNAELESLVIRRFLEVPELKYNRVEVKLGDKWNASGAGIFEAVVPDYDENGNPLMTGTGWLKLEDGEIGAIAVGDICLSALVNEP